MSIVTERTEKFINEKMAELNVPGIAVGVVKDGALVYQKGFGFRDVENKLPVEPATVYPLASTTKAMTAVCAAILKDEKKLDFRTPIINYIPEFRMFDDYATKNLCLRDMFSHNSGLPRHDFAWYGVNGTLAEFVEKIRYLKPNKPFRTLFEYNNFMFATAGYVIEKVSGKTWHEFIKERLFTPLGMKDSSTTIAGIEATANKAFPYKENKDGSLEKMPFRNFDGMGGAGTGNSSVVDMSKWLIMNLSGGKFEGKQIVAEATLKELHTPVTVSIPPLPPMPEIPISTYGYGWNAIPFRGKFAQVHTGGIDGISTFVGMMPGENLGVVVLTNSGGQVMNTAIGYVIFDEVMGLPFFDWATRIKERNDKLNEGINEMNNKVIAIRKPDSKPTHELKNYAGTYEHKGYGKVTVTYDSEKGLIAAYNEFSLKLVCNNYNVFEAWVGEDEKYPRLLLVSFDLDLKGDIKSLSLSIEPGMGEELTVFEKLIDNNAK
ncbi:MAG: serine hydrolase [Treponema sp.]|nr:serine hydrolase [Treponema sp.]